MARLLVLIALFALASAELTRIPMKKRQNHILSTDNIRIERNYLMQKHQTTVEDNTQECVVNIDHTIKNKFYAEISVGTPPQVLNTVFDTSGFLAYISTTASCATCSAYNVQESSTATVIENTVTAEIDYLDLQNFANYSYVQDIFNIGGINAQLKFALNSIVYNGVDMIFGLGLPYEQYLNPPLFYMYQERLLENLEYSLYYDTNNDTDFGGHLIVGGVDPTVYSGELTKVNYTDDSYAITFTIDSFSINGVVAATEKLAIIESATNFIGVPLLTYIRIGQQIGGIVDDEGNYFVDCDQVDSLPDVSITIGGNVFTITPQSYILRVSQGLTPCMSAFTYLNSNVFNLGQPFLTNFYTTVNINEQTIGFASLT